MFHILNNFSITFDTNKRIKLLDDILKNKLHSFPDINPVIHVMRNTELNNLAVYDEFFKRIFIIQNIYLQVFFMRLKK